MAQHETTIIIKAVDAASGVLSGIAGSFGALGSNLNKIGRTANHIGLVWSTAVTAPIAAATKGIVDTGVEWERAWRAFNAKAMNDEGLAIAQEALEKHKQLSIDIARATKFGAIDIMRGQTEMAAAGLTSNQIMGALKTIGDMATAENMTFEEAADKSIKAVVGYYKVLPDSVEETTKRFTRVNDVLSYTAGATTAKVEELFESFKNAGPVASVVNMSLEDTAAILGALHQSGFTGEQAGVAVRTGIARILNPTKRAMAALNTLRGKGVNIDDFVIRNTTMSGADVVDMIKNSGVASLSDTIAAELEAEFDSIIRAISSPTARNVEFMDAIIKRLKLSPEGADAVRDSLSDALVGTIDGFDMIGFLESMGKADVDPSVFSELFRTEHFAKYLDLAEKGKLGYLRELSDKIKDFSTGSTDTKARMMFDGLVKAVDQLAGAFENLKIKLIESPFGAMLTSMIVGMTNLLDAIAGLDPELLGFIGTVALIAAAAGPVLIYFGLIAMSLGALASSFGSVASAARLLLAPLALVGTLLSSLPMMAVGAAAAFLGYQLYEAAGAGLADFAGALSTLSEAATVAWEAVTSLFSDWEDGAASPLEAIERQQAGLERFYGLVNRAAGLFSAAFADIVAGTIKVGQAFYDNVLKSVVDTAQESYRALRSLAADFGVSGEMFDTAALHSGIIALSMLAARIAPVRAAIMGLGRALIGLALAPLALARGVASIGRVLLAGLINPMTLAIAGIVEVGLAVSRQWDHVKGNFAAAGEAAKASIANIGEAIGLLKAGDYAGAFDALVEAVRNAGSAVASVLTGIGRAIAYEIGGWFNVDVAGVDQFFADLTARISSAWEGVKSTLSEIAGGFITTFDTAEVVQRFDNLVNAIKDTFAAYSDLWEKLKELGGDMNFGGITDMLPTWRELGQVLGNVAETAAMITLDAWTLAFEAAEKIIRGVIAAIDGVREALKWLDSLTFEGITKAFGDLADWIISKAQAVADAVASMFAPISEFFGGAATDGVDATGALSADMGDLSSLAPDIAKPSVADMTEAEFMAKVFRDAGFFDPNADASAAADVLPKPPAPIYPTSFQPVETFSDAGVKTTGSLSGPVQAEINGPVDAKVTETVNARLNEPMSVNIHVKAPAGTVANATSTGQVKTSMNLGSSGLGHR